MQKRTLRKLMKSASSTPLTKIGNKVRRFFLCLTKKEYVREQEQIRHGECFSCGKCCMLPFRCPFLLGDEDHYRCAIYDGRPGQCRAFPIDEKDLADVNYHCGYFFMAPEEEINLNGGSSLLPIHITSKKSNLPYVESIR